MSRQALPHEVLELTARLPLWLPPFVNWSVRWSFNGWPLLRRLPLHLSCFIVKLYVLRWL